MTILDRTDHVDHVKHPDPQSDTAHENLPRQGVDPEILKAFIAKTGLSVDEFARTFGIPKATMRFYLESKKAPSLRLTIKMADYFAVPVDVLLGRCTENQEKMILKNYSRNFMKLRRATHEEYLVGRRDEVIGNEGDVMAAKGEPPWPYNLLSALTDRKWHDDEKIVIDYLITAEHEKEILAMIDELEPHTARNLLSYYRDGLTIKEIAEQENVTYGAMRVRLLNGLQKLRHPAKLKTVLYGHEIAERSNQLACEQVRLSRLAQEVSKQEQLLTERLAELERLPNKALSRERLEIARSLNREMNLRDQGVGLLELSARPRNCLKRYKCDTIDQLIRLVESGKLLDLKNLGRSSYDEILLKLKEKVGIDYASDFPWHRSKYK